MEESLNGRALFEQARANFKNQLEKLTVTAVDGRCYVLVDELRKWMRAKPQTDQFDTNTELLVHAAYPDVFHPIDHWRIAAPGEDCCVLVFSILLDLKLEHLIHRFAMKTILDSRLPEDLFSLKNKLRDLEDVDGEKVAEEFNKRQWRFCPALFKKDHDYDYVEERIIPICRKSALGSGGIACVSQIVVQSEFVDEELKKLMVHDEHAFYDDRDYGPCYTFALKTFEEGRFDAFRDEQKAFDGLRGNSGVIRRLGSYSHRTRSASGADGGQSNERPEPSEAKTTKNLLLEFGTYDLKQIFGTRLPPVLPREVVAFWQALFEVADALHGIHNLKTGGSDFNGWHADIKPENIIYVRNKYKLADPGFARFKRKDHDGVPRIKVHGGTDTYGAPEVSRLASVDQTIDTWSLGCVFSMAATWVILGDQGVRQYQKVREKALAALLQSIEQNDHPLLISQRLTVNSKPEKLDCFHNGTDVVSEVTSWHAYLRNSARKSDPITVQVLDLIDKDMLLRDPTQRIKSGSLCKQLKQIVGVSKWAIQETKAAESTEDRNHRQRIEGLLCEIDNEADSKIVQEAPPESTGLFTPGLPVDRNALQLHLDQVALRKTSHRFEIKPEPLSTVINTARVVDGTKVRVNITMGPSEDSQKPPDFRVTSPNENHNLVGSPTFSPKSRVNTYNKTVNISSTYAKENVIQAHESMVRESRRKGSLGGMMPKRRPRKDEFLSTYFRNRDIKFLVDDAHTMSDHWDEATFLLETLVKKAHGQDPDGPDLSFTNHRAELRSEREAAPFRRVMEIVSPTNSKYPYHTDMRRSLQPIFDEYLSMVQSKRDKSKVNALTVIILTDGLWQGMNNRDLIFETIVDFYKQLEKQMHPWKIKDRRQVSLQFIQFGDDEEARERLRRLDDDLPFYGIDDIVDRENYSVTGNVFKMLLGSFVEKMDEIDNSSNGTPNATSLEESPPWQAPRTSTTSNLPLHAMRADENGRLPQPEHDHNTRQTPAVPQTPERSHRSKRFSNRFGY